MQGRGEGTPNFLSIQHQWGVNVEVKERFIKHMSSTTGWRATYGQRSAEIVAWAVAIEGHGGYGEEVLRAVVHLEGRIGLDVELLGGECRYERSLEDVGMLAPVGVHSDNYLINEAR